MSTLPDGARARMGELAGWSAGIRRCSSHRMSKLVPRLEPWGDSRPAAKVMSPFTKLTALEVWALVDSERADDGLRVCVDALHVLSAWSHSQFVAALSSRYLASSLLPACSHAWLKASPRARHELLPDLNSLRAAWPDQGEFAELMRLHKSGATRQSSMTSRRSRTPSRCVSGIAAMCCNGESRPETHSRLRNSMRTTASGSRVAPQFDRVWAQTTEKQQKIDVLAWLANGATDAPPFGGGSTVVSSSPRWMAGRGSSR